MTNSEKADAVLAVPGFRIGQSVRLKAGGPEMIVNYCTLGLDGKFIVDTIWFGVGSAEEHGSYQEALLESYAGPPNKRARLG